MTSLVAQRCWNHTAREAVARCPECGHFFCRECITEHEDRVVCSACLKRIAAHVEARRVSLAPLGRALAAMAGLVVAAMFFFIVGRLLVNSSADFHEGTLWERTIEEIREGEP